MPEATIARVRRRVMSKEIQALLGALSADAPCGIDLEDSQLLASFDAYRLFGSDVRLPADTDWREIRDRATEALAQSKDLRLLAHLSAALLHVQGLDAFCESLGVADTWLRDHWAAVFPRVNEDAILRKNALSCFADRMAIVDAVRRAPIVSHRQLGSYSLRHLELATGQLPPTESDLDVPSRGQIDAAIEDTSVEYLQRLGIIEAARLFDLTVHQRSLQHAKRAQASGFLFPHRVGDGGADLVDERHYGSNGRP